MSLSPAITVEGIQVESFVYPPSAKPPGSTKTHFLGGAGVRAIEIQGKFLKVSGISVYLEAEAVPSLATKWKGKSAAELADSAEFFADIVTGPFEKFMHVRMILPLPGVKYSEKVMELCVQSLKSAGTFTDTEAAAVDAFLEIFRDKTFPPDASILYTQQPEGSLTIAFSDHGSIPAVGHKVIKSKLLAEAVFDTLLGTPSISPETKVVLAARLSDLLKDGSK